MKNFVLPALAVAALMATAGGASAQTFYYSGPGYGPHLEPRYERDYDRRDYRRYNRRAYSRNANGCPPRYTVQDGVCKPYRGY